MNAWLPLHMFVRDYFINVLIYDKDQVNMNDSVDNKTAPYNKKEYVIVTSILIQRE